MKILIAAIVLAGVTAAAQASDVSELQSFRAYDVKTAAAQYVLPAPEMAPPQVKTEAGGLDQIIYVPAHYGILAYDSVPQVAASWFRTEADAVKDMNKLILSFQQYGIKAEGSVREDYWHGWGFIVSYSSGKVTEWSAKKYFSKTDAENAALRFVAKLRQEGQRPLLPIVETEQLDNGVAYRVNALCHKLSDNKEIAADKGRVSVVDGASGSSGVEVKVYTSPQFSNLDMAKGNMRAKIEEFAAKGYLAECTGIFLIPQPDGGELFSYTLKYWLSE